jgi:hypothetical protein
MADLSKEEIGEVERLAEPAENECEILGKNEGREEALKQQENVEEKKEVPKLPKLSAAEFRAYNSMAEHMEYFVSYDFYLNLVLSVTVGEEKLIEMIISTIISANLGQCSTIPV